MEHPTVVLYRLDDQHRDSLWTFTLDCGFDLGEDALDRRRFLRRGIGQGDFARIGHLHAAAKQWLEGLAEVIDAVEAERAEGRAVVRRLSRNPLIPIFAAQKEVLPSDFPGGFH